MKLDIVQEILGEPLSSPPSSARQCAEAAQRLYQAAFLLCEKFRIELRPEFAQHPPEIHVEVWSTGTPKGFREPVVTNQLWLDPATQRFANRKGFAPVGPKMPFGSAWLLLSERPRGIASKKQPKQDKYKVKVATWTHPENLREPPQGPNWKKNVGLLSKDSFSLKWEYARWKVKKFWYVGEAGETCDKCTKNVEGVGNVFIEKASLLCFECWTAKRQAELAAKEQERRGFAGMGGQKEPSPMNRRTLFIQDTVPARVGIPAFAREVNIAGTWEPGDRVLFEDANQPGTMIALSGDGTLPPFQGETGRISLPSGARALSYVSNQMRAMTFRFYIVEPVPEPEPIRYGYQPRTGPGVPAGARTRRAVPGQRRLNDFPSTNSPLLQGLIDDFASLSPFGKSVALVSRALLLNGLMNQPTNAQDAFNDPLRPVTPARSIVVRPATNTRTNDIEGDE